MEEGSLHSAQLSQESKEQGHVHKTRGVGACLHMFAHNLFKEVKEPLVVFFPGKELRGWGPGWEGNFTFYFLLFKKPSACINIP